MGSTHYHTSTTKPESTTLGRNMQVIRTSKNVFLVVLMMLFLSGCFGEEEAVQGIDIFQIVINNHRMLCASGEWHEFQLLGNGRAISVPTDVMLFVDGYIIERM